MSRPEVAGAHFPAGALDFFCAASFWYGACAKMKLFAGDEFLVLGDGSKLLRNFQC